LTQTQITQENPVPKSLKFPLDQADSKQRSGIESTQPRSRDFKKEKNSNLHQPWNELKHEEGEKESGC